MSAPFQGVEESSLKNFFIEMGGVGVGRSFDQIRYLPISTSSIVLFNSIYDWNEYFKSKTLFVCLPIVPKNFDALF